MGIRTFLAAAGLGLLVACAPVKAPNVPKKTGFEYYVCKDVEPKTSDMLNTVTVEFSKDGYHIQKIGNKFSDLTTYSQMGNKECLQTTLNGLQHEVICRHYGRLGYSNFKGLRCFSDAEAMNDNRCEKKDFIKSQFAKLDKANLDLAVPYHHKLWVKMHDDIKSRSDDKPWLRITYRPLGVQVEVGAWLKNENKGGIDSDWGYVVFELDADNLCYMADKKQALCDTDKDGRLDTIKKLTVDNVKECKVTWNGAVSKSFEDKSFDFNRNKRLVDVNALRKIWKKIKF